MPTRYRTPEAATGAGGATCIAGIGNGAAKILSPGHAFDLPVAGGSALTVARRIAEGAALDVNLVATEKRRKKLLVADMDSTIITVECLDELADMAGLKPQIAAITERAMRGELEFETALKERVGMLKGLHLSALEKTYAERVRLNPGAKSLLATMRANGAQLDPKDSYQSEFIGGKGGGQTMLGGDGAAIVGTVPGEGAVGNRRIVIVVDGAAVTAVVGVVPGEGGTGHPKLIVVVDGTAIVIPGVAVAEVHLVEGQVGSSTVKILKSGVPGA